MRALVQRVSSAAVDVDGERIAEIGPGLLVLLGVARGDSERDAEWIARKVRALRVFEDGDGRRGASVVDASGELLCVSQFTLYGDTRRGNRPSYTDAAEPELARPLYELACRLMQARAGRFGAHMEVTLVGDGPVTLMLESPAAA